MLNQIHQISLRLGTLRTAIFCGAFLLLGGPLVYAAGASSDQVHAVVFEQKGYQINLESHQSEKGLSYELSLTGWFNNLNPSAMTAFLKRHLRKVQSLHIQFNFYGGYSPMVEAFGSAVKSACSLKNGCRITTEVQKNAVCASYCVHLFMLGQKRLVSVDSQFGFHAVRRVYIGRWTEVDSEAPIRQLGSLGVSNSWLRHHRNLFATVNEKLIRADELSGSNIMTDLVLNEDVSSAESISE